MSTAKRVIQIERDCHQEELFVRSDGTLYPCCLKWGSKELEIAHIADADIVEKINKYAGKCICERYKLIPKTGKEHTYNLLNIELAYKCQAKCAMCCVHAPDADKDCKYEYYFEIEKLIQNILPKKLRVQGGEVLMQPEAMDWLEKIKLKFPEMELCIVTNGCVGGNVLNRALKLFDRFYISIVGFQSETYKTIMGLDLDTTKNFAKKVIESGEAEVHLKYLTTPSNFHELSLFLDWAIKLVPDYIIIADAFSTGYLKFDTFDDYWNKIIKRSSEAAKKVIIKHRDFLKENKSEIVDSIDFKVTERQLYKHKDPLLKNETKRFKSIDVEGPAKALLHINRAFVQENDLENIIKLVNY